MSNIRIALGIEYDGSAFAGWQTQAHAPSVQATLEKALSKIANDKISVICAGRTDAGVHALEQVVHFDTRLPRPDRAWLLGGNSQLPDTIRITWIKPAPADFHARYSALARLYRYTIYNRAVNSALTRQHATWCYHLLDAQIMHRAAQCLLGHHDFSSFRAQSCQSKSPMRAMYFIDVQRVGELVTIELCANAFLHHMVRNIAGALIAIGTGKQPENWLEGLLAAKDRRQAGITAPPVGLCLAGVCYPEHYGIARQTVFTRLPPDIRRFDSAG